VDNPENLTPQSLAGFLQNPGKKVDIDSIHAELQRRRKMQGKQTSSELGSIPNNESSEIMTHDSAVRQHLAELVKNLMSHGKVEQLESLLKEHRTFINDILEMLSKGKNK
jgi:hypothetical protein